MLWDGPEEDRPRFLAVAGLAPLLAAPAPEVVGAALSGGAGEDGYPAIARSRDDEGSIRTDRGRRIRPTAHFVSPAERTSKNPLLPNFREFLFHALLG